jgi:hypothetical protein
MVIETGLYGNIFFKIYATFIKIILCAMYSNRNMTSALNIDLAQRLKAITNE